jgi:mono/diheme cytochrome c family protein
MRWLLRWLLRLLVTGTLFAVIGAAYVYGRSEWILRTRYSPPLDAVPVPRDAASIAEGGRLYRIVGCATCHGNEARGRIVLNSRAIGHVTAPGLARAAAGMTDKDMVRAIRYGVGAEGRSLYLMPIDTYAGLSDDDVGRIIGWIRSLRPKPRDLAPRMDMGPIGRLFLTTGATVPVARTDTISQPHRPPDAGRYIVEISCAACHDLEDARTLRDGTVVPPMVRAMDRYEVDEFEQMLRTGLTSNQSRLPAMTMLARTQYSELHDDEMAAIYAYLREQQQQ